MNPNAQGSDPIEEALLIRQRRYNEYCRQHGLDIESSTSPTASLSPLPNTASSSSDSDDTFDNLSELDDKSNAFDDIDDLDSLSDSDITDSISCEPVTQVETSLTPTIERVAIVIQRFVRTYCLRPCINDEAIHSIPPAFRFRLSITHNHFTEYSEVGVEPHMLNCHRVTHSIMRGSSPTLFAYCFDIRELRAQRHTIIEVNDMFIFLQPDDHMRLGCRWRLVH